MHFSTILLAAAATLLPSVMADCPAECVNAVNACCAHNTKACDDLGPNGCGADFKDSACANQRLVCNQYCGDATIGACLQKLRY